MSPHGLTRLSEKDAKLAQKLGQLQPFIAVFPQECVGQLAHFGPTSHLARSVGAEALAEAGARLRELRRRGPAGRQPLVWGNGD